ncbi:flagellar basal body-associated FliL family protein [Acuticoccus sp. MNP-M23]|uniref:flagellar basal body-associated FliL family protein n=1 Tax=Acuticoccus sp. MNP-M23 TaxID=3072793 RepID=UPI002815D4B0|nr:flagellar basal body-associated FliL family protein [Acuticoccus sp. MNP-M23]WMS41790.1 flagellar basal body-associated FliL family protein [Acuticoccus sp. MNP-M23]
MSDVTQDNDAAPAAATPKSGKGGLIVAIVALTVLGGGAGAGVAFMQVDNLAAVITKKANEAPEKVPEALAWSETSTVTDLDPIISNLANPATTWIRIESSMVFDKDNVEDVSRLKAELAQTVLGYVRTLTLGELQGAGALNHLRADLNERARLLSNGLVQELIIKSMVLQ